MKVNLKIKEDNTVQTVQHEVEEVNIRQITKSIKTVKSIVDIVREDKHLQALLTEMFDSGQEDNKKDSEEEQTEEATEELFGKRIMAYAAGAMDVLLMEVPEKVFELLSIMSNIEYETFMQQKPDDVFDIYDAIIQVNDIDKLVNRAKKSLALTKAQTKVMNLFPKKEQQEAKQA